MSIRKTAVQVAHAVKNLGTTLKDSDIVVSDVSKKKFFELISEHPDCYVQIDKGLTEVRQGEKTDAVWIEK